MKAIFFLLSVIAVAYAKTSLPIPCSYNEECNVHCRNWFGNFQNPVYTYRCDETRHCECDVPSTGGVTGTSGCTIDADCIPKCPKGAFDRPAYEARCVSGSCHCP